MVKVNSTVKVWLWSLVWVLALLFVSGLAWLILENWVRFDGEFGPARWSQQSKVLQLHGWLSAFAIFLLGYVMGQHIVPQWRGQQKRRSGGWLFGFLIFLSVSGVALYYIAHENFRAAMSVAHWALGISLPLLLVIHLVKRSARPGRMASTK